jgi:uncharacterized membrane protein YkvA (DUF1232 family)
MKNLNQVFKPYKAQFDRCPTHIKILAILCVMYLSITPDPFDILFPWAAFSDDIFIAGILLKILHKHGGLPEEDRTTPIDLLRDIFKRVDKKQEDTYLKVDDSSLAVHLFKDNVCSHCGLISPNNTK